MIQAAFRFFCLFILLTLSGCASHPPAPVIERSATPPKSDTSKSTKSVEKKTNTNTEGDWRPDSYTVKKGDTLYSIGLEFGFDYKEIAQWNNITTPYVIRVGQTLKLKETSTKPAPTESTAAAVKVETPIVAKSLEEPQLLDEPKAVKVPYSEQAWKTANESSSKVIAKTADKTGTESTKTVSKPVDKVPDTSKPIAAVVPEKEKPALIPPGDKAAASGDDEATEWSWPTSGKIISTFSDNGSSKGIDISGNTGQAILAAAAGKVVYSGSGLRGYGKLIILKHNKTYLSAYAHNSQILVKEGQEVAKGQKIAEMGNTDTDRVKLHFEIRRLGKPVDPGKYLTGNPG